MRSARKSPEPVSALNARGKPAVRMFERVRSREHEQSEDFEGGAGAADSEAGRQKRKSAFNVMMKNFKGTQSQAATA